MNIKYHKEEVIRWLRATDGTGVWTKHPDEEWELTQSPAWSEDTVYIVDDKYAEIRKEWIDAGKPPVQHFDEIYENAWCDISVEPGWNLNINYRFKTSTSSWRYAKPVTCEEEQDE